MKIVHGLAALLIAGCASTGTILATQPDRIYRSARSSRDVGNCLRVELSEAGRTPIVLEGDSETTFLFKNSYGATDLAFTVKPEGEGSLIELRRANFPFTFSGAENCFR
jgi:hypothetical protein